MLGAGSSWGVAGERGRGGGKWQRERVREIQEEKEQAKPRDK